MKDSEFFWEWLQLENTIFNSRGSLFLVAESMLIAAISAWSPDSLLFKQLVYFGGFFVTVIWILVNMKHIYGTHRAIIEGLRRDEEHPWNSAAKERTDKFHWSNHTLLGILLPLVFLLVWLALAIGDSIS